MPLQDRVAELSTWPPRPSDRETALFSLEQGEVLHLPKLAFQLQDGEETLLDPGLCDGRSKNISYDPSSGRIGGLKADDLRALLVKRLMERFSVWSLQVAKVLLPAYAPALQLARTSLRPCTGWEGKASMCRRRSSLRGLIARFSISQGRRLVRASCSAGA